MFSKNQSTSVVRLRLLLMLIGWFQLGRILLAGLLLSAAGLVTEGNCMVFLLVCGSLREGESWIWELRLGSSSHSSRSDILYSGRDASEAPDLNILLAPIRNVTTYSLFDMNYQFKFKDTNGNHHDTWIAINLINTMTHCYKIKKHASHLSQIQIGSRVKCE